MKKFDRNKTLLFIAIIICIISTVGSFAFQTDFGNIKVKHMQWET